MKRMLYSHVLELKHEACRPTSLDPHYEQLDAEQGTLTFQNNATASAGGSRDRTDLLLATPPAYR